MTYRVCYGYMQQTTVPCDSFADALAVYREHHKDDPSGAQVYNDDRADGESNGLTEDELDALDEVHWPRPTGESDR